MNCWLWKMVICHQWNKSILPPLSPSWLTYKITLGRGGAGIKKYISFGRKLFTSTCVNGIVSSCSRLLSLNIIELNQSNISSLHYIWWISWLISGILLNNLNFGHPRVASRLCFQPFLLTQNGVLRSLVQGQIQNCDWEVDIARDLSL